MSNYNCASLAIDSFQKYKELFYLLMIGAGVGVRVLPKDVSKLPKVRTNIEIKHEYYSAVDKSERQELTSYEIDNKAIRIIVGDSKEAWTQALEILLKVLSEHYFKYIEKIYFNYDNVRPKGERLKTFGGHSSGHQSIKKMFDKIDYLLKAKTKNRVALKPLDALDIANIIGENVVSGGVRRTSEIGLFDKDDQDILQAKNDLYKQKNGKWELNEKLSHRQMSNNSILYKEKPTREQLHWQIEQMRYSGEPGFINKEAIEKRRDNGKMVNPCAEILLDDRGMCNLVSLNVFSFVREDGSIDRKAMFEAQRLNARSAYRMALVEFELPDWDYVNKRDRLIGLSLTGWQDMVNATDLSKRGERALLQELRTIANNEAEKVAKEYNDEVPVLVTTVKPEGCITKDHTRVTDQGILFIDEIDKDIESNPAGEFKDIEGFTREGNAISSSYLNEVQDIVRLELENGREIKVSRSHPLSVDSEWVEAHDIEIGDKLDYRIGSYDKKTSSDLLSVSTDEFREGSNGYRHYDLPEKLNSDLSWLVGAYLANGSFPKDKDRKHQHRIKFHCEHLEVHEKVQEVWKEQFSIDTNIVKSSDRNSYTQDISSVQIRKWFKENGFEKESYNQSSRIPERIRTSSKRDIVSFIVGYADNDGCFYSQSFCIDSADSKFIRHLQEVGEAVGLSFSYVVNSERSGYSDNPMYKAYMSRVYSDDKVISYINEFSVKAQKRPLKESSGKRYVKYPYRVVEKEVLKDEKTYGIQVENEHWYYQGALKSHNTQTQMPTVSSGLHYNHSPYYIRRVRINVDDPLALAAEDLGWNVKCEVGQTEDNCTTKVIEFPVKAPDGRVKGDVSAIEQLETYKMFMENYVDHNASITIHVRDDEWEEVEEWMWNNWDTVVGISFISYNDSFYDLMPYEEITEEEYTEMVDSMNDFKPSLVNKFERKHKEKTKKEREIDNEGCEDGVCPVR